MGKESSSGGGSTRVTTHDSNGGSEDKTYDSHGKCVDINHHDRDGDSHSHEVGHGFFGTFAGKKKD